MRVQHIAEVFFSAFWLRSSVVSVLISLISGIRFTESYDINLIFGAGRFPQLAVGLQGCLRTCTLPQTSTYIYKTENWAENTKIRNTYRKFSFADVQQPCASSCTSTCKVTESIGLFRVGVLACHHHVTLRNGSSHQLFVFLLILTWMGSCHDQEDGRPCLVCFHCTSVMDLAREHRNGVSHIIIYARGGCGTAASTISIWQQICSIHT